LTDVSFQVRSGELLGLIGPNGAGKSTLFECMAGVVPCDSGEVIHEGRADPGSERLFGPPPDLHPACSRFVVSPK
jgi:ABC-type multidrug transport system ATPase subunit